MKLTEKQHKQLKARLDDLVSTQLVDDHGVNVRYHIADGIVETLLFLGYDKRTTNAIRRWFR